MSPAPDLPTIRHLINGNDINGSVLILEPSLVDGRVNRYLLWKQDETQYLLVNYYWDAAGDLRLLEEPDAARSTNLPFRASPGQEGLTFVVESLVPISRSWLGKGNATSAARDPLEGRVGSLIALQDGCQLRFLVSRSGSQDGEPTVALDWSYRREDLTKVLDGVQGKVHELVKQTPAAARDGAAGAVTPGPEKSDPSEDILRVLGAVHPPKETVPLVSLLNEGYRLSYLLEGEEAPPQAHPRRAT